jgi:predicted metal-dependent phosphoesterase TrpH
MASVDDIMNAYFLHGINGEKLMVIRGTDEDLMQQIIATLQRSRNERIKDIAETLENHFNERNDDGGSSIQTRSKNKKTSRNR